MRLGMGELINKLLSMRRPQDGEKWDDLQRNACHVLRGLSIHDDYRKDMSSAHDNGRCIEVIYRIDKMSDDLLERTDTKSFATLFPRPDFF